MIPQLPGDSDQIKVINEWTQGFKEMNPDLIGKSLHKDFRRVVYPRSLGQPALDKDGWVRHVSGLMSFATAFESDVHSVIEAPGKIVVHATTEVKNSIGLNTICEAILIVHVATDDDGCLKITHIDEFNDSKVYLEIGQAMVAARAK